MRRLYGFLITLGSLIFLNGPLGHAEENALFDTTVEVTSTETNANLARKDLVDKANFKVSEDLIKQIIGDSKYQRNKNLIRQKVIQNSGRYIVLTKTSDVVPITPVEKGGPAFKMNAQIKINQQNLEKILLDQGLFYESDGTPIVIPFIRWRDQLTSQTYAWWIKNENTLVSRYQNIIETSLRAQFQKNGFYLIKPFELKYIEMIPEDLRSESLRTEDLQGLAQKWNAQVFLTGTFFISKHPTKSDIYNIEVSLKAQQTGNARLIADLYRQFETEMGPQEKVVEKKIHELSDGVSQEISAQVLEAWQKGTLGSNVYYLTLRGSVPLPVQEALKAAVKSKFKDIRQICERKLSSQEIKYEIDSSVSPIEISKKISSFEGAGFQFVLGNATDREIIFNKK